MDEYLRVKAGPLGHAVGSSRLFHALAMATPGMRELLSMGKIWELAQLQRRTKGRRRIDLVIVDAPATGHGVGILRTPKTFADIARVGPIAHQGRQIAATIADRQRHRGSGSRHPRGDARQRDPVSCASALADEDLDAGARDRSTRSTRPGLRRARWARWSERSSTPTKRSPAPRCALRCPSMPVARRSRPSCTACARGQRGRPMVELPFVFAEHLGPARARAARRTLLEVQL